VQTFLHINPKFKLHPILHCLALLICASVPVFGQTKVPPQSNAPSGVAQMQKQVGTLESEVKSLQVKLNTLESQLAFDEYLLGTKQVQHDHITLNLAERTYQRLDTDNGFFLISVREATPYLNGYKIHLHIGNPSFATYAGFTVKTKWGKVYNWTTYSEASFNEWQKSLQEKEVSFPDALDAGAWNNVEVILAPATADQLGYIELSLSTDTVKLTSR
jgi:hypothetical protein